ncbi:MAG: hypothetical protein LLF28_08470 [Nitrospiraceae bacterium]|nr:hypothetical protein [Nitrospiraceae bacterium]
MIFYFIKETGHALFFVIIIFLFSCTEFNKKDDRVLTTTAKTENIPSEIKKLDENKNDSDMDVRAKVHLRLAVLYSSYKNPNPNYYMALKELEAYILLDPDGAKNEEIQNLLGLLREIDKAKHKAAQIMRENKELKDTMEKLKALDIKMEQKRKKVK